MNARLSMDCGMCCCHEQEALASRHPSSVAALLAAAKPGPAEAAALAAAAASITQLEAQLGQQQASHEACLRQLQQQYEALKARLEQKSAAQQVGTTGCFAMVCAEEHVLAVVHGILSPPGGAQHIRYAAASTFGDAYSHAQLS
jgi:hypothetical protein